MSITSFNTHIRQMNGSLYRTFNDKVWLMRNSETNICICWEKKEMKFKQKFKMFILIPDQHYSNDLVFKGKRKYLPFQEMFQ